MRKTTHEFSANFNETSIANLHTCLGNFFYKPKSNFKNVVASKCLLLLLMLVLSFAAKSQISVTSTLGTGAGSGGTYTTLKQAFDSVNTGYFKGVITISVTASTTESTQAALNASGTVTGVGTSSYTALSIKPATGVTATIACSVNSAVIKLNGADNITIDGSNATNGTTKDLTIQNTNVGTSASGIWVSAVSASNAATLNTIKNCNIIGGSTRVTGLAAITSSGTTLTGTPLAPNHGNTYTNNALSKANYGIITFGAAALDSGLVVNSNSFDSVLLAANYFSNQNKFNVFDNNYNTISTITTTTSSCYGILVTGNNTNGNIYRNKVYYVRQNNTAGTNVSARGISLNSSNVTSNISVFNNMVGDVSSYGLANAFTVYGILTSTGGGYKVYHNTVNLTTSPTILGTITMAFGIGSGITTSNTLDVRNNIFSNQMTSGTYRTAIYFIGGVTNILQFLDNNDYSNNGAVALAGYIAGGTTITPISDLSALRTFTSKDSSSVSAIPTFVSATDLHITAVAGNASINNGGVAPLATVISADIDGTTRSTVYPDMGADEIIYTPKVGSFSPASACAGSTVTVNGADFTGVVASGVSLAGANASSINVVSTSQLTAVVAGGYSSPNTAVISVTNGSFGSGSSSATLTRLAPGTYTSKSLSTASPGDQVLINGTNFTNASAVSFNGVSATFSVTNSTEIIATVPVGATTGNILITDACGNSVNAGSITLVFGSNCVTPGSQATSLSQATLTTTSFSGSFTAATGSPSGYLVVYSTGSLSATPNDGTTYTAGSSLGGGTILRVSASTNVSITGLTGNTSYIITVFAYNGGGCSGGPLYRTTTPLVYNFITCPSVPTSLTATPVASNTGNAIDFGWSLPSGGTSAVLAYSLEVTTDAAFASPVSGSPFSVSGLTKTVSGLNLATKYYYRVRATNGCFGAYASGNVTTGCGAGTILPYTQNFDASSSTPSCWTIIDNNNNNGTGDGTTWSVAAPFTGSGLTGLGSPNALRYRYNSNGTTAANDWAMSPGFLLTGGVSYTLSFKEAVASSSFSEALLIKYGTSPTVAAMTSSALYDNPSLTNIAAALQTATFTVPSTGVYYFGFQCYSAANHFDLYVDDIQLEVTPPPPTAPSNVTFTNITPYSATANWTDNSNNELGYYVYSSLDGTNYTLQATVGANVTSASITNLKAHTLYYIKVTGYNTGGENTNGATNSFTTTSCTSYTTTTYTGPLVGNSITNFNVATSWSTGHTPNSCEDVVVNSVLPITNTAYLYLNTNTAIHNLSVSADNTGTAVQRLFLWTQGFSLDISGGVTVANNRSGNTSVTGDAIYLVSGPGVMTIDSTTNIGVTGNRIAALGAGGASLGPIYFRGDANFGPQAFTNYGNLINFIFDAPVAQTVNVTSTVTSTSPDTYGFGAFTVGSTNSPTVTLNGTGASTLCRVVGDFAISNGSTLIIPSGQNLNRTTFGGNFTLGANSLLKASGATGGAGSSNFPNNFATFNVDNTSTVEYNGTSTQDVSSLLPYGKLKINNASNVRLTGGTTVNNLLNLTSGKITTNSYTLTLGLSASISGASSSNYINGNLAKTIGSATSSKLFEIGDTSTYTPVTVSFVGGSTNSGGVFTAKTTTGTPAALGYLRSGISSTAYLKRTYKLTNSGVTGFTSISPTFNYADTDRTVIANNTNYQVADSLYGGGWSLATTTNPTTTSTAASGIAFASPVSADFLIGEIDPAPAPVISSFVPTSACEGSSYVVTGSNFYAITGITIGGTTVASYTVNSPTQITLTVPVGANTGVINVANATGNSNSNGSLTVKEQPQTTVSPSTQTICSGDAITNIVLGNSGNVSGTTYSWTRTTYAATGTVGTNGTTDPTGTLINAVTVPVLDSFLVTASANGCTGTVALATVTVKASPGTVTVTPTSASICQTVAQQINSSYTAATGSSVKNSGAISLAIPDNNVAGVNTILNVNDVPSGAVITGIDVQFDITHTFNSDLSINLTAPNGKTLNLAHQVGFDANNGAIDFYHTVISSASSNPLPDDGIPTDSITGTYAASLRNGVGSVAYPSNTTSWSQLYSTPNGAWRLSARDYFSGDVGTIKNYRIKIYYTLSPTFSWTPQSGLYTDAGFTAYTGGSNATVYAKNVPGNYTYNARISFNGCTVTSSPVNIDIDATPIATRTPASQSICSGSTITSIVSGTSNSVSGTTFSWTRDHTSDVSGTIGNSGSGDIAGTLINTTSSPITVTFTITPTGPATTSCAGAAVTATVTVNPRPIATATPASQGTCSGSAITQISFGTSNNISGTSYAWTRDNTSSVTGIASSGSSFVSGTLTNNTAASVDVTFTISPTGPVSAGSCSGTSTQAVVTVSPRPATYTVSGGGNYCSPGAGLPVNLSNSQTGVNYQLLLGSSPVGSAVAGTGSAIAFGNQTTVGTYTVVASNGGCTVTMTGSATITATTTVTPTVSIAANATSVCYGTNVSFFAVATNTGSSPTYNFIVNGTSMQNTSSNVYITNTLASSSSNVISCIMTSNNTCQTTATATSNDVTVAVNSLPTVAAPSVISGTTNNCTIGSVTYLGDITPNGIWSSSNTNVATIHPTGGKVTSVANGNAIINYTVTGSNGCTNSAAIIYTVAEVATPTFITGTNRVCVNSTVTLSCATAGGTWSSLNNAATIGANTGILTGTNGNSGVPASIRYTISNAYGCSKFSSYNVTVNANPGVPSISYAAGTTNPQYNANGGYCINKTFTVVGSPTGGAWVSSVPSVASVTSPGGVMSTLALGTTTLTYTYTNVNGCSNKRSITGTIVNCPGSRGVDITNTEKANVDFTLYPNPAKGKVAFNVDFFTIGGNITVTDIYGKQVKSQPLSIGANSIDISNLSKGFYLVNVTTTEGKTTKKLIVE